MPVLKKASVGSQLNTCLETVEELLHQIARFPFVDDEDYYTLATCERDINAAFNAVSASAENDVTALQEATNKLLQSYGRLKNITKESLDRIDQVAITELSAVLAIETAMKHNILLPAVSAKLNNSKNPEEYFYALVTDREQRIAAQKEQAKEAEAYRKSRGTPKIGARF